MDDSPDIIFSQYAQDPLENFTQNYEELIRNQQKKRKQKRDLPKKKTDISAKSFVISKERRGYKMIQIKILELSKDPPSDNSSEDDEESVVISAQYIVKDPVDEIVDITEGLVKKISKKLCGDVL